MTFTHCRNDAQRLMNDAGTGLLGSHEKGFYNAINAISEGTMLGLLMILTDVGGGAEAVQRGESGLAV